MAYTSDSSMHDIVAGLCVADARAASAFVARQGDDAIAAMPAGAELLADCALRLKLADPTTLMAWRMPDRTNPLNADLVKELLDAACRQRFDHVHSLMARLPFSDLVTIGSLASFLKQSALQLHTP